MPDQPTIFPLKCPTCGRPGVIAWNMPGDGGDLVKCMKNLLTVSQGFHWERGRGVPEALHIICDLCHAIQP